jgi:AraC-like DNA-binding protein
MGVFRVALSAREPDRELTALGNAGVDIRPGPDGFRPAGFAAGDDRFCAARVEFGGSPRGIQYAFRRSVKRTPIDCLRRMRLSAAHADPVDTDPRAGVTVEAIAGRWGFSHMSRFSAQHRARFGELPRETIRRQRPRGGRMELHRDNGEGFRG